MKKTKSGINSKTCIEVRPQAHGGKFIGDDIGGAIVTIKDAQTGEIYKSGLTKGGAGALVPEHEPKASSLSIFTHQQKAKNGKKSKKDKTTQTQWVCAVEGTSSFRAELDLQRPTLLDIHVHGPLGGQSGAHSTSMQQWVTPGDDLTGHHGVVVPVAGLLVQVLSPATHIVYQQTKCQKNFNINISANVTMMCGCPIKDSGPWLESDFDVSARIIGATQGDVKTIPLEFTGETSLFSGAIELCKPDEYLIVVSANQKSICNSGLDQVSVIIEPKPKN